MPLSEDDKRRIEEDEYRKHVQSQLQNTQRLDVNLKNDQRIETHGVGREIYRDVKRELDAAGDFFFRIVLLVGACLIIGLLISRIFFEKTVPNTANWSKCSGRQSGLAPISSTTHEPPLTGKNVLTAGRSTPGIVPSR